MIKCADEQRVAVKNEQGAQYAVDRGTGMVNAYGAKWTQVIAYDAKTPERVFDRV